MRRRKFKVSDTSYTTYKSNLQMISHVPALLSEVLIVLLPCKVPNSRNRQKHWPAKAYEISTNKYYAQ